MTTPRRASFSMFSSAMAPSGVSRGTRMSFRFSLIATAAALVTRLSAMPVAIFARLVPLHGTTTTAWKRDEPDAGAAARFSPPYTDRAPAANSFVVRPVSISITAWASFERMTSARSPRISMRRLAYSTPEAPETATTTRASEDTLVTGLGPKSRFRRWQASLAGIAPPTECNLNQG